MKYKCTIPEEKVIDYIQGHLDYKQQKDLKNHLDECDECRKVYHSWVDLFQSIDDKETPSPKVKKRIMKKIHKYPTHKKWFGSIKPAYIFVSACVALITLFIGYTINPKNELHVNDNQTSPIITNHNQTPPFMVKEETDVYEVVPVLNQNVKGYVWINNRSNEMLLLVDGLRPIRVNDYQAWVKTTNELKNAGIMKVKGQTGQLYFQDGVINQLEQIMVSKEPIGGSKQPTDPNPFLLKLNAK